jgi:hypothetical protein
LRRRNIEAPAQAARSATFDHGNAFGLVDLGFFSDRPCRDNSDGRLGDNGASEPEINDRRGDARGFRSIDEVEAIDDTDESDETESAAGRISKIREKSVPPGDKEKKGNAEAN